MDRVVVHSVAPSADSADQVVLRLRSRGVEIVEEQPHMLLVSGTKETVGDALGDVRGWKVTDLVTVPRPRTRVSVSRKL
jgi:hypothetical protein